MVVTRAVRRFRQQVWSPKHPERRIVRMYRCVNWRKCGSKDVQTEGHHIDYDHPFIVVWVCRSCHRLIESGSLRVLQRWVYNYESLVKEVLRHRRTGEVVCREAVPF